MSSNKLRPLYNDLSFLVVLFMFFDVDSVAKERLSGCVAFLPYGEP